jgi:hypothetical protein
VHAFVRGTQRYDVMVAFFEGFAPRSVLQATP